MLADVSTGSCLDLEIGSKFRIGRCKGCGEVGYKVNDIAIGDNLDNPVITMTISSKFRIGRCWGCVGEGWHTRTTTGHTRARHGMLPGLDVEKVGVFMNLYLLGWGLKRVFCAMERFEHLHIFISNETVLIAALGRRACMRYNNRQIMDD